MNMLKLFDIIPRDDLFEEICNLRVDQEVDEEKFDPEVRPFMWVSCGLAHLNRALSWLRVWLSYQDWYQLRNERMALILFEYKMVYFTILYVDNLNLSTFITTSSIFVIYQMHVCGLRVLSIVMLALAIIGNLRLLKK